MRDLAVGIGDIDTALDAVRDIAARFEIDVEAMRSAALSSALKARLTPSQAATVAREARALAEARLAADEFEQAVSVSRTADEAGRRTGDTSLQGEMAVLADFCRDALRRAPQFRAALRKLDVDPSDAAANTAVGEFLTLVKQEWGRGLLMLSRGTDRALAAAASAELAGEQGPPLLKAAIAYDDWAGRLQGRSREVVRAHARALYERAVPSLNGADKQTALTRLAGIVRSLPPGAELADRSAARLRLGDERFGWWQDLNLGPVAFRDDGADLKYSQATLDWRPRLTATGDLPDIPPSPDGPAPTRGAARLTYRLRLLCTDETGRPTVLERAGKFTWRDPLKPIRVGGPANQDLRKYNAGKPIPANLFVEIRLDGVLVYQRLLNPQISKAWWLDDELVLAKSDR